MVYSEDFKNQVIKEYLEGASSKSLGKKYHLDFNTATRWVKKQYGESYLRKSNNSKYSNELKTQTVQEYLSGHTMPEIGKKYNISPTTIEDWINKAGYPTRNPGARPLFKKQTIEEKKDYQKKYRELHKEENKVKYKEWRQKNKDYEKQRHINKKEYFKNYYVSENYKTRARKRQYIKYHTDTQYRLVRILRGRVRKLLKESKTKKLNSTLNLLGCSFQEFKKYLESKFTEGMTWEKLGKEIHLDHIKPCSTFDLSKLEEQKKCFNYTNIQPLWAIDNLKKSNKWVLND